MIRIWCTHSSFESLRGEIQMTERHLLRKPTGWTGGRHLREPARRDLSMLRISRRVCSESQSGITSEMSTLQFPGWRSNLPSGEVDLISEVSDSISEVRVTAKSDYPSSSKGAPLRIRTIVMPRVHEQARTFCKP